MDVDEKRQNTLQQLCTKRNRVRESYYGTTHRASFTLGEETKTWDILHIEIPFSPQKEAEFMRRFHIERDALNAFYKEFSKAVLNHIKLAKQVQETGENTTLRKSIVTYKAVQTYSKMDSEGQATGTDVYMISEPMDAFVGSESFQPGGTMLKTVNNLGIRLLQTAKTMNDNGLTMGGIDLESYYLVTEPSGKKILKNGYLFYSSSADAQPGCYTQDISDFVLDDLSLGNCEQSFDTDVYTICKYLWNIYDGQHYSTPADLQYEPRYAPQEIIDALKAGLQNGASAYKTIGTTLRQVNKRIDNGELPNAYIPFVPPSYELLPMPEPREEEVNEEDGESPSPDGDGGKKKRKARKGGIVFILLAVILFCATLYDPVKNYLTSRENPGAEQVEETPQPPVSADAGLYVLDRKVYNADGTLNEKYVLNEEGCLVPAEEDEAGEVLYTADQLSPYIPADDYAVQVRSKDFAIEDEENYLEFKPEVRDISGTSFQYDSEGEDKLPAELVEAYGIDESSILIVTKVPEDEETPAEIVILNVESRETEEGLAFYAVEPDEPIAKRDLQLVRGSWTYGLEISISPEDATNKGFTVYVEDAEHTLLLVNTADGQVKAKAARYYSSNGEPVNVTVLATVEGRYVLRIESADGMTSKRFAVTFDPDEAAMQELEQFHASEHSPEPSPEPSAEPTPYPTPENTPLPDRPGGGYSIFIPGNPTDPPTPDPTPYPTTEPAYPAPTPDYTPSFTVTPTSLTLKVGQSASLFPSESCTFSPSPTGIVRISGNTVTGVRAGSCTITLTCTLDALRGQQLKVYVTVTD